jgi:hypothetical protein
MKSDFGIGCEQRSNQCFRQYVCLQFAKVADRTADGINGMKNTAPGWAKSRAGRPHAPDRDSHGVHSKFVSPALCSSDPGPPDADVRT